MPRLYIISGCNGSGKTTASYTLLPELLECSEFVNSDEFAKSLSPFDPSAASVRASRYMLLKIRYLLDRKADFCIETTLATRSLVKIIDEAKGLGYSVTILYFWLNSPELAIERVHDRVLKGGHNITDDVVRRRYLMGLTYFFKTYSPICDRWVLADNSHSPFTVVAEGNHNDFLIRDEAKYKVILEILSTAAGS
ncbi:MAG: zeta toxin family protein [Bacteroidales bacterium]|nr:zeta toxin family protein [Candidatus Cryptobacteroides aphodequi]